MATRERPVDRGARRATIDAVRVGAELRQARVSAGLPLASVGRATGISASQISRIERARAPSVTLRQLARIGAVVGLEARVRTYPGPDPVRDLAHIRLLERLRVRLHPDLLLATEVPLPDPGDQRAWDGWISGSRPTNGLGPSLPVEAESRISDVQAVMRRVHLKLRDAGLGHVLLVVADTRADRAAIGAAGALVDASFPVPPRRALQRLAAGEHPGGSALVFL
jgi:transcriptional regulator with XRE-family HTH domain